MSQIITTSTLVSTEHIDPILLQSSGHPKTSEKYYPIQTHQILQYFERAGFEWKLYKGTKSRKLQNYGKHTVLLTSKALGFKRENLAQEMQFRIILGNSHDGTWRFFLKGFIDREICSNKMVMSDALFNPIRFTHRKDMVTQEDIIEAVEVSQRQASLLEEKILFLKSLQMSEDQKREYAHNVALLRLSGKNILEVNSEVLLQANRQEDSTNSAWHVVNTVQENLFSLQNAKTLNYKFEVFDAETQTMVQKKSETSRALRGLNPHINLNAALFDEAMKVTASESLLLAA